MVKLTKIYTRGGDKGMTSLVDASRVTKHAPEIEAVGAVEEVGAAIGLACNLTEGQAFDMLRRIQNDLFDLGADLATPGKDFTVSNSELRITPDQVLRLEREIDEMNASLEPLTSFILPGGSEASAQLHMARTITRRAERRITALSEANPINPEAVKYVNRLSDHLFVLARRLNDNGNADVLWVPGGNR